MNRRMFVKTEEDLFAMKNDLVRKKTEKEREERKRKGFKTQTALFLDAFSRLYVMPVRPLVVPLSIGVPVRPSTICLLVGLFISPSLTQVDFLKKKYLGLNSHKIASVTRNFAN